MRRSMGALAAALLSLAGGDLAAQPIEVKEIGSFHIGGRQATLDGLPVREIVFTQGAAPFKSDPNGDFEVEQMYAQYVRLANPRAKYPMLLIHGGGLTGVTWETKPDGAPGWQMYFLRQGHDIYVSDAVERGRASWARYPEIFKTEPFFRAKKEAWELFRIGPPDSWRGDAVQRVAYPDSKFPTKAFDQFGKQGVPRWATNDTATQKAYDEYVQRVCPCTIVVHSQGGNFAMNAALSAPDKVKALVLVEPSGAPDPAKADAAKVKGIPHLFLWGDHFEKGTLWERIMPTVTKWREALETAGAPVEWVDLPKRGIAGNSHMLMMDTNSDEIAGLVQEWLQKQAMMK
jgi:pimeloyl-ACP methyl ester carboxylesterase